MCGQDLALRGRQLQDDGHEQALTLGAPAGQALHHLLEQHALVRHVLIDDCDALVVHRDDEGVAELPQRRHGPDVRHRALQPTGQRDRRQRSMDQ